MHQDRPISTVSYGDCEIISSSPSAILVTPLVAEVVKLGDLALHRLRLMILVEVHLGN